MSTEHEHCWHDTGVWLVGGDRPEKEEICCHCGLTRMALQLKRRSCGPYFPDYRDMANFCDEDGNPVEGGGE